MTKILTILVIMAVLGLSSCKKDKETNNDPAICSSEWADEEYDALIAAWNAYSANMSVENCNAYKTAFQDYIDALEPFLQCTATWTEADRQEVQDAIDESEEAMNELTCE